MSNKQLTVEQAAEIAGCSAANIRFALKAGSLKGDKFGKMWVIWSDNLEAWMKADIHKPGPKKKK
jgi:excisionase family DNA binding protein